MVSSFQLSRSSRLSLTHQKVTKVTKKKILVAMSFAALAEFAGAALPFPRNPTPSGSNLFIFWSRDSTIRPRRWRHVSSDSWGSIQ